jgi:quercetin dioxygenase-like cupin family protein
MPPVSYVRLYTDESGQSRFDDLDFAFAQQEFAPPAPPLEVSEPVDAAAFMMLRAQAGWTDPAHPSPARQFLIVLKGSWEVSAGGETRVFSAGDVVLTEDISGPGHASTIVEDTVLAVIRL